MQSFKQEVENMRSLTNDLDDRFKRLTAMVEKAKSAAPSVAWGLAPAGPPRATFDIDERAAKKPRGDAPAPATPSGVTGSRFPRATTRPPTPHADDRRTVVVRGRSGPVLRVSRYFVESYMITNEISVVVFMVAER